MPWKTKDLAVLAGPLPPSHQLKVSLKLKEVDYNNFLNNNLLIVQAATETWVAMEDIQIEPCNTLKIKELFLDHHILMLPDKELANNKEVHSKLLVLEMLVLVILDSKELLIKCQLPLLLMLQIGHHTKVVFSQIVVLILITLLQLLVIPVLSGLLETLGEPDGDKVDICN